MTYFADLTPYEYRASIGPFSALLNVGWLEPGHPVPSGPVDPLVVDRLAQLCGTSPVAVTRGAYRCRFSPCRENRVVAAVVVDGRRWALGGAEIWLPCRDGTALAAPNMVHHYVTVHGYRPPDEFLEAIMGPDAGSFDEKAWVAWLSRN
ncbi:DUF7919 family protein [Hamadaea tsunoensis]|uniref:DUF7919 family protein n=1 Tax=Hamadaea tsunoensis TaxID=53368 RepID=UPI00041914ED|nr:hypothetical protein [Hamadaea tsunoensis]